MSFRRWLTAFAARGPRPDVRTRAEVLEALGGEGCPVCRSTEQSVRRWFFAYENDTRVDPDMRERLERSGGFCAPHTRHLLDMGASVSWLARWVFADVARAGGNALAAERPPSVGACPACEAAARATSDALATLAVGLVDPEARQLLEAGDGLCLTHGLAVAERGAPMIGRAIVAMLDARLAKDPVTARDQLVSADPDIARRRRYRETRMVEVLDAEEVTRARPAGDVDLVLDWPCCPLCAAAGLVEWRYLRWLSGTASAEATDPRGDVALCVRHVADLAGFRDHGDPARLTLTEDGLLVPVAAAIEHVAGLWRVELQAYLRRLEAGSLSQVKAPRMLGHGLSCQLCGAQEAAVRRQLRLMGLVASDQEYAPRMARSHGVCLRHGRAGGGSADSGADPTSLAMPWRRLLQTRIGLLSYALDEAERKSSWDARWEVRGSEMVAWRRAPTMLDGAVLGPFAPEPSV
ncbi:hypothetical protein [Actinopolymorpha sp. B9G3]|uniref:hypothetical protein n=1 Tax=Actinopolymorpha sp. B9G3 TaxID=3158970 RepID=UPI0032D90CD4